jgi:hypothetical protein
VKNYFIELFNKQNRKTTIVLLIYGIVSIASGLIKGIDDNPPGIILLYLGIISLMVMFVRHWRSAKKFLIFSVSSIIGFIVFAILHNVMYGLHKIVGNIIVLSQLLVFLDVSSFLLAVIICPPGVLVGAVGTMVYLFKGRRNPAKNRFVTMKKKIAIILIVILVPVAIITLIISPGSDSDSIITEKDSSFVKKVQRIFVIATVEEHLKSVFAHSFEHSIASAFQSNGVDAIVTVAFPESDSLTDYNKEDETFTPDATMRININPLYRARDDGYQAIVGTDFEASLIDMATQKKVWHATGKVDYIVMFGRNYTATPDIRKEFAWNTTAAIVRAFIEEVNGQKPEPIYTVTESRERHGQRVD